MRKLTTEEFIRRAKLIHGDKYNYDEVEYVDMKTKVKIWCNTCKKYFYQSPSDHLNKKGCKDCGIASRTEKRAFTKKQFVERATEVHKGFYSYENAHYANNHTPIDITCPYHGVFSQLPFNHLVGEGCPECKRMKIRNALVKGREDFIRDAVTLYGDRYDYSEVDYVDNKTKVRIKCNVCGRVFEQRPNDHLSGHGCPYCANQASKPEEELIELVKPLKCERRKKGILSNKRQELDVYIDEIKLAIEHHGLRYHNEKSKGKGDKYYHLKKTEECNEQGIGLIQIFEDERVRHRKVCDHWVRQICGLNDNPEVYGKDCVIKEVNQTEANEFLERNTLFNSTDFSLALGAYYNNEMVSLIVFKKEENGLWIMGNAVDNIEYNCVDVAKSLFNYFLTNYTFIKIITYVNRRWLARPYDNVYTDMGFVFDSFTEPSYTYYNERVCRNKRFTKEEIDENEEGYFKVWDCGQAVYAYTHKP